LTVVGESYLETLRAALAIVDDTIEWALLTIERNAVTLEELITLVLRFGVRLDSGTVGDRFGGILDGRRGFFGEVDLGIHISRLYVDDSLILAWSLDNMGIGIFHGSVDHAGFRSGVLIREHGNGSVSLGRSGSSVLNLLGSGLDSLFVGLDILLGVLIFLGHLLLVRLVGFGIGLDVSDANRGRGEWRTYEVLGHVDHDLRVRSSMMSRDDLLNGTFTPV
jgi:hypothetical protein